MARRGVDGSVVDREIDRQVDKQTDRGYGKTNEGDLSNTPRAQSLPKKCRIL